MPSTDSTSSTLSSLKGLHIELQAGSTSMDKYPAKQHARRTAEKLQVRSGLIYLPGQPSIYLDDSDQFQPFRQRRYFFYISGVNEPDCSVTYDIARDTLTLYIPYVNPRKAVWFGTGLSLQAAQQKYDIDNVKFSECLSSDMDSWIHHNSHSGKVYLLHPHQPTTATSPGFQGTTNAIFDTASLLPAMNSARTLKSPHEIRLIRHANQITAQAHTSVLRNLHTFTNERDIEACFLQTCVAAGVRTQSYKTIAGSGENAAVLHYMKNDEPLRGRQLVCLDAGCDWECYASDVTRTFPVNGYLGREAERVYALVKGMQEECIRRIRPGVRYGDLDRLARRIMVDGLMKMGILKGGKGGVEEVVGSGVGRIFFPHGLGHHLGLEVHDVSEKPIMAQTHGNGKHLPPSMKEEALLEAGMVLTVEPGIYFSRVALDYMVTEELEKYIDMDEARRYLPVGGVRIEDDILVTQDGYEILTTAPKGEAALEIIREGASRCS
ncbi:MAG: hypothetical protein Q9227_000563 [Pyrenula ochraceoflavens]